MFWPGSLFLGAGFAWAWKQRDAAAERFLIAWAAPLAIVLEFVPTKLPHYLLPAYPALALMAGAALAALGEGQVFRQRWLDIAVAVLWVAAGLAIAVTLVFAPAQLGYGFSAAGIVAAAVILIFGGRMLRHARRYASPGLGVRAALLALLVFPLAFALVAPQLDRLWLSRSAAALVSHDHVAPGAPVSVVGYTEPSLVFLLGTKTRLVGADAAAAEVAAKPDAVALVERRDDAAFRQALQNHGSKPRLIGQAAGLDYSNDRAMVLTLYGGAPK
jgi:4-amino-4-deoxy-L-arabinose transferase-like glycosyltransferase